MVVNEKRLQAKLQSAALRLLASIIDEIGLPYEHTSVSAETVNAHVKYLLNSFSARKTLRP